MRPSARLGTLLCALSLLACSESHRSVEDAGVEDARAGEDSGTIEPGTCSAEQRAGATLDLPRVGLDGAAGSGPWSATISNVAADGVDLVLADGTAARFRWTGTSLAGLSAGMSATLRRDPWWTVLEAGGVRLHAMSAMAFTGYDLVGAPIAIAGAPALTLVEACAFREGEGACDQPAAPVTIYALDVGGAARLGRGEQASGPGYEVSFGGAVQLPGYGSPSCVLEAAFGASIALRVDETSTETCEGIEGEYRRVVDENASCSADSECMVLGGQCGVGLGGCYEAASADVSDELEELGRRYAALGCTSGVCDCAGPPLVACDVGRCTFAP